MHHAFDHRGKHGFTLGRRACSDYTDNSWHRKPLFSCSIKWQQQAEIEDSIC